MTVQSSIIMHLISLVPDPELRAQITAQYYQDVESQANFVQNRIGHLEIDLREQVQLALGNTNDMIAESVKLARDGGVALRELRSDFRDWIAQVVHISEDVDELRTRLNEHDREIASFRESRDQSIADRAQLKTDLAESKADRASIHQELREAKIEREQMMIKLETILERIAVAPGSGRTQELIDMLLDTKRRVDTLEGHEQ